MCTRFPSAEELLKDLSLSSDSFNDDERAPMMSQSQGGVNVHYTHRQHRRRVNHHHRHCRMFPQEGPDGGEQANNNETIISDRKVSCSRSPTNQSESDPSLRQPSGMLSSCSGSDIDACCISSSDGSSVNMAKIVKDIATTTLLTNLPTYQLTSCMGQQEHDFGSGTSSNSIGSETISPSSHNASSLFSHEQDGERRSKDNSDEGSDDDENNNNNNNNGDGNDNDNDRNGDDNSNTNNDLDNENDDVINAQEDASRAMEDAMLPIKLRIMMYV
jgi:hypothetical protein